MNRFEMELAGRPLVIENGQLAKQANGAVLVRYGDTVVLVTATASAEPRERTGTRRHARRIVRPDCLRHPVHGTDCGRARRPRQR